MMGFVDLLIAVLLANLIVKYEASARARLKTWGREITHEPTIKAVSIMKTVGPVLRADGWTVFREGHIIKIAPFAYSDPVAEFDLSTLDVLEAAENMRIIQLTHDAKRV